MTASDNGAPIVGAHGTIEGSVAPMSSPAFDVQTAGSRVFTFQKGDNQSLLGASGPELSARQIRKRRMVLDTYKNIYIYIPITPRAIHVIHNIL